MPIAATTPSPPPRSSSLPLRLKTLASTLGRPALSFGAEEVSGFDLRALADHGTGQRAVHDALLAHGLLIFRGQRLTEAQELALATRFPHDSRFRPPALEYLGNVDRHGTRLEHFVRGGRYWHVDGSQNALPMVMSWISAAEPGSARCGGSRTLFASGVRALELLDESSRELACGLAVRYSTRDPHTLQRDTAAGTGTDRNSASPQLSPLLRNHDLTQGYDWLANPLVRVHPQTGQPSLWPSPGDMECFELLHPPPPDDGGATAAAGHPVAAAMGPAESHQLLSRLLEPGTQPEHVYSHEWRLGDVVVWDNRSMIHSTEAYDYDHASRHMHLAAMKGPADQPGIPLRVGTPIAGLAEIRALWWGESDPRRWVMGSRPASEGGGRVPTFTRRAGSLAEEAKAKVVSKL